MMLEVKNISYAYANGRTIFSNIEFSLNKGEILTILGPNGSGKTTLLNCLANIYLPNSGGILINGVSFTELKLRELAQMIGYVPQIHMPVYAYNVRDFVVMGRAPYIGMLAKPKKSDYDLVDDALEMMEITHLADRSYTEISGGERQLVTIARVIVQQPDLILLDEPTAHLDYGNQLRTVKMIKRLAQEGYAVIMTSHMPDHAVLLEGKVGILDRSGHMCVGPAFEILQEDVLKEVYRAELKLVYIDEVGRVACVASGD
ncbi:MAG TPA: ABC transporter ATP-binding protein [Syntrophomonadaceae bacterium]|nr:ABC transporter ATP-binding protein [Syntrophomonadaceae bacterium]